MRKAVHMWGTCPLCFRVGYKLTTLEIGRDAFVVDLCSKCLDGEVGEHLWKLLCSVIRATARGETVENQEVYVFADDGMLYKNPIIAGEIDDGLAECFVRFSSEGVAEVVIETIQKYPPHRGLRANDLWTWYIKAAKAVLDQLGVQFLDLRRSVAGQREFNGSDFLSARTARAFSFLFELAGPLPQGRIGKHSGILPCLPEMGKPESSYILLMTQDTERSATDQVASRVKELRDNDRIDPPNAEHYRNNDDDPVCFPEPEDDS